MENFILILFGIGLAAGFAILFFTIRRNGNRPENIETEALKQQVETLLRDNSRLEERARLMQEQAELTGSQLREKESRIVEISSELSGTRQELANLENKLAGDKAELQNLQDLFRAEFRNLANDLLDEKSKKFTDLNRDNIDRILIPLKEKIAAFESKVEEVYNKEAKERFSLEKEIRNLAELNQQISTDAKNLTTALRADTKKQGNWGELVLERVLEGSGLVKGQEYLREVSGRSDQGDVYRPDVVVKLPDDKHIIIDSKVSLNAYNDYVAAETADERERLMKAHLLSIRNHVRMLGEKNYHNLGTFDTPDYVLLFIPIESSFSVAIQADAELFSFAWERNVVIVSPTTLLATLKTVASIWKHEKQTQNAIEIAKQGGLLYDKFVSFLNDLEKLGGQLDAARKSYDEAHRKLHSGNGNLIGKVEKLKELGAKTSKEIPQALKERSKESLEP